MRTRRILSAIAAVLAVPVLLLGAPLSVGVWLPDIWGESRTLAEQTSPGGYTFRVVQYWNHFDFYTTDMSITAPDGTTSERLLDGDDAKSWRVPISIDESQRTATTTLRGNRIKVVHW